MQTLICFSSHQKILPTLMCERCIRMKLLVSTGISSTHALNFEKHMNDKCVNACINLHELIYINTRFYAEPNFIATQYFQILIGNLKKRYRKIKKNGRRRTTKTTTKYASE